MLKHLALSGIAVLAFASADLRAGAIAPGQYYTDAAAISNNTTINDPAFRYFVNDDAVFAGVSLGFTFTLFGQSYDYFTISNNGNVQFGINSASYSAIPLDVQTDGRMIAPYWSDLISGGDPSGLAFVYLAKYPNEAIVTWESMGEYNHDYTRRVSFQLVIRGPDYVVPADEGVIGFSYKMIDWGSGSGTVPAGSHGASAGFGDGYGPVNPGEVSYLTAARPRDISNTNVWFNIAAGIPAPASTSSPEPGTWIMLGAGIALIGLGRLRARFTGYRG